MRPVAHAYYHRQRGPQGLNYRPSVLRPPLTQMQRQRMAASLAAAIIRRRRYERRIALLIAGRRGTRMNRLPPDVVRYMTSYF